MKVIRTVTTVEGTLYEGEVVRFQEVEKNGDYRVKDSMGRIWFLNKENLKLELNILLNEREKILTDYNKLSDLLNKKGASKNAAEFILSSI